MELNVPLEVLSGQQRQIQKLIEQGCGAKKIAKALDISVDHAKQQIRRIKNKTAAVEEKGGNKNDQFHPQRNTHAQNTTNIWESSGEIAVLLQEAPAARKTVSEYQVLQMAGKGLTVKSAAARAGKTENSVRGILKRNGISAHDYKSIDIKNIIIPYAPAPVELEKALISEPALTKIARYYFSNYNEPVSEAKVLAEINLRAAGKLLKTPAVFKRNAGTLKRLLALSHGKKVLCVTPERKESVKREVEHYRPQRLYVNVDCAGGGGKEVTEYIVVKSDVWAYFEQAFAAGKKEKGVIT